MTVSVRVKPGSRTDLLFVDANGQLTAKIKAPAQDGKANAYLIEFLANQIGVSKSSVTLISGFTNPNKRLRIAIDEAVWVSFLTRIG